MENILPRYVRPISGIEEPAVKVEHWDGALEAFDKKEFKKSVIEIINYVNSSLLEGKSLDNDVNIVQMHGSAEIHVKITDSLFSVKAPFLKITDKTQRVALLRQVAEVNFSPLRLEQIKLEGNELWFEYEMPIELAQPHKVYDLLRSVSVYADDYDDMFIDNYGAEFYKKPKITELSDSEKEQVWGQISNVFEDYNNYTQFFKETRRDDFQWDNLAITMLKLANMPYVHGKLRSDLVEHINNLFNPDIDFKYRVDRCVNYMKKLIAEPKESIMSNIYNAEHFISLKWRSSKDVISDRLKHFLERVQSYEKENNHFYLSYYLQFNLLKLIYDFNLEEDYKKVIEDVLEEVSGLEPQDAAPKLAEVFHSLRNGTVSPKKKSKGFFSRLFS